MDLGKRIPFADLRGRLCDHLDEAEENTLRVIPKIHLAITVGTLAMTIRNEITRRLYGPG